MNKQQQLSNQIYELSIQIENRERAEEPILLFKDRLIKLRNELSKLRQQDAQRRRDNALWKSPDINREDDGDILWA